MENPSVLAEFQNCVFEQFAVKSDLNEDCLFLVFEYLNALEFLKICHPSQFSADSNYMNFLKKRIISRKVINITEIKEKLKHWSELDEFIIFGKYIRKLKVRIVSPHSLFYTI